MKKILLIMAMGVVLLGASTAWPKSVGAKVNISCIVEKFAEWEDSSPVILATDWSGKVNKSNQTQTVTKTLKLLTNADTLVTVKPGLNDGILTNGTDTLKTSYKITGAVLNPDYNYIDAHGFFNGQKTYTVIHQAGTGSYQINLEVQASSPKDKAPDEGVYTCSVILTATW